MKCPICHHIDTKVVDSRMSGEGGCIRRRRECLKCKYRFSTREEIEILDLSVIKNNTSKESYSREKLLSGIKKALEKREVEKDEVKKMVNKIESDIHSLRKNEITSKQIGRIIMKHLKKTDQVAYIRFASVYQDFKDVEEFREELNKILKKTS